MKHYIGHTISLVFLGLTALANAACEDHFLNGESPLIKNQNISSLTTKLCYQEYASMYSGLTKTPIWSAQHLTAEQIQQAKSIKRSGEFFEDPNIPMKDRSRLNDYRRSGYSRGHMAPSADFTTLHAQNESFALSNIVPQDIKGNEIWAGMESSTRAMATRNRSLYVITGPVFLAGQLKHIGNNVLVPTLIYKAIYDPRQKLGAAYLMENKETWTYHVVSIADLERLTGLTLFPTLSNEQKQEMLTLPNPRVPYKKGVNFNRIEGYPGL